MALTLLEAAKLNSGDVKRSAIIEMFAQNTDILRVLPFDDIVGGALVYNQEGSLPGVAFRGFNEGYDESVGVINPQAEVLRIAGGDLDVDKALIKTKGAGIRSTHEAMKVKALALHIADKMINGDSVANPRQFDGLRVRFTGSQLIPANLASPSSNLPLSLAALDKAIDAVDSPNVIITTKEMKRRLTAAARANVGGDITFEIDEFGRRVTVYNGLPLLVADYNDLGQKIIDFNEAGPGGSNVSQSMYILNVGDGMITGIQNGTMEVTDLGELDAKPVLRTRIEWLMGLAVMHGRAGARVWGITDAPVTT